MKTSHSHLVQFTVLCAALVFAQVGAVSEPVAKAGTAPATVLWADQFAAASGAFCEPAHTVVDTAGNVYTAGRFSGTTDFDPGVSVFEITPESGVWAVYITKINPDGSLAWAKSVGDTGASATANSVAVDGSGNVYVTGVFSGTIDFDPGPGTTELATYSSATFMLKLNASGGFVWAKQTVPNSGGSTALTIAVREPGQLIISGVFDGTIDFDPGPGVEALTAAGSQDIYVCALDLDGNFSWVKRFGGAGASCSLASQVVDGSGVIYTTGGFSGTVDFDPGSGTYTLTSSGSGGVYVSKLDADGGFVWTRQFVVSNGVVEVQSVAVDSTGAVYSAGYFNGTIDFDAGPGVDSLTAEGMWSSYLNKLDADGTLVWTNSIGGTDGAAYIYSVAVDSTDRVYALGQFNGDVDFDSSPGAHVLSSSASSVFVGKWDALGRFLLVRRIGDGNASIALDSGTLDDSGNIYLTGQFSGTADFSMRLTKKTMTAVSIDDTYVLKLATTFVGSDISGDAVVDAVDVQLVINRALGLAILGDADVNRDGVVNAIDVQRTINAALGIAK